MPGGCANECNGLHLYRQLRASGKGTAHEPELMYQYEPELYKSVMTVFGQAYELTDRFKCRRRKCLPDSFQRTLTGKIERNET